MALLTNLRSESYLAHLPFETFVDRSAFYFAELNYIHPFREGNGHATREFMRQLFDYSKYRVSWDAVSTEQLLLAMEASVYDTSELKDVLMLCLSPKID